MTKPKPKLTIGMAHFDDFHGAYFTLQSIKVHHPEILDKIEFVVVDNNPGSPHGVELKKLMATMGDIPVQYIPFEGLTSTTQTRDRIFRVANGEAVLCMDCHVLLPPGALARLIEYYDENPGTLDLFHGPLLYDDVKGFATHFDPVWRGEMWGVWASMWAAPGQIDGKDIRFTTRQGSTASPGIFQMRLHDAFTGDDITDAVLGEPKEIKRVVPWNGHHQWLKEQGFTMMGEYAHNEPFEIPAQGLGLFTCRKDAWLGFNPHFRGFGGEECYIHEKFRQAGRRTVCLPFLRWNHRFARPDGVKYPLHRGDKVRNYVLGFQELGLDLEPVHRHFVQANLFPQYEWDALVKDPVNYTGRKGGAAPNFDATKYHDLGHSQPPHGLVKLDLIFQWLKTIPRDLDQHLDTLRKWAGKVDHITEFTKRRESTVAFLAANRPRVVTYSTEPDLLIGHLHRVLPKQKGMNIKWTAHLPSDPGFAGDVLSMAGAMEETDLLFIDGEHTAGRIYDELFKYGQLVKKHIILRGTYANGEKGEDGGQGLRYGIQKWMDENPDWFIAEHTDQQYGLTVLSRDPAARPEKTIHAWPPGWGAGTELKKFLKMIGITATENCKCNARAITMDMNGAAWCKENIETILDWLQEEANKRKAIFIRTGVRLIVNRCIKRAAKQEKKRWRERSKQTGKQ